jgi:hypothetical protein
MATLISSSNGSFTAASTWGVVDATSFLDSEANSSSSTVAFIYTGTFIPGAITVDGVAIKIAARAAAASGTVMVSLTDHAAGTHVETVSIPTVTIPSFATTYNHGWYFFKFSGANTLTVGKGYKVGIQSTPTAMITVYRNATTGNWSRMLRTTAGAPAANDQLHVMGYYSNAGSGSCTVVMDNVATTSFGTNTAGGVTQGITVDSLGTLQWGTEAATNYYLKWRGPFVVFEGGTLSVGTPAAPIPASSTAVLETNCVAVVDSYLTITEGGVCNMYGTQIPTPYTKMTVSAGGWCSTVGTAVTALAGSQSFLGLTGTIVINAVNYTILSVTDATHLTLTATAGAQTGVKWTHPVTASVMVVGTTAGWSNGDALCVASTSLASAECEKVTIASVASGTHVTLSGSLTKMHFGTDPMQAEVGNLTRNVILRSNSATLVGYFLCAATSTVYLKGVAFSRLGRTNSQQEGIVVLTVGGVFNMQYCSVYDFTVSGAVGLNVLGAGGPDISVLYCVVYNINTNLFQNVASTAGQTIVGNLFMSTVTGYSPVVLYGARGVFQDNTVVGNDSTTGVVYLNGLVGIFKGNILHCGGTDPLMYIAAGASTVTIEDSTFWGASSMVYVLGDSTTLIANNLTIFACDTGLHGSGFLYLDAYNWDVYGISMFQGDLLYTVAVNFQNYQQSVFRFTNCSFGRSDGIKIGNSGQYFPLSFTDNWLDTSFVYASNCTSIGELAGNNPTATDPHVGLVGCSLSSLCAVQRYNGTAGDNRLYTSAGTASSDSVIFDTTASVRLTPSAAGQTLDGAHFSVVVVNGNSATVSVKTRESVLVDGAAYNGARPALYVKRNDASGILSDTLLATATAAGSGAFETLSASIGPVTDNAVLTCFVRTGGTDYTTGWVNVDTLTTSPPSVDTGGFNYWKAGETFAVNGGAGTSGGGGAWAATYTY